MTIKERIFGLGVLLILAMLLLINVFAKAANNNAKMEGKSLKTKTREEFEIKCPDKKALEQVVAHAKKLGHKPSVGCEENQGTPATLRCGSTDSES